MNQVNGWWQYRPDGLLRGWETGGQPELHEEKTISGDPSPTEITEIKRTVDERTMIDEGIGTWMTLNLIAMIDGIRTMVPLLPAIVPTFRVAIWAQSVSSRSARDHLYEGEDGEPS